jgi:UDP-glucose 4-epimerase
MGAMRAIVTGGAGFIASHLTDALVARGDDVLVVDDLSRGRRENVDARAELAVVDVRDHEELARAFERHKPDVCFHFAAQPDVRISVDRPAFDCEINVIGTINVLEAARAAGARIVFASTGGAIYGECERPATEDDPRRPLAPYGAAKLCAEEYIATFERLYGDGHVALRLGNVYGPRQDPHGEAGVVAIFLGLLAEGGTPKVFGDGSQTRDYVYVADVVRAAIAAQESGSSGVFNVGTGRETSVLELLQACCRVAGVEAEPEFAPPRQGELARNVLDPSLAERVLGVRAETAIDDGLRSTWEWIREKERV